MNNKEIVREYFSRPAEEVAANFAMRWSLHNDKDSGGKQIVHEGLASMLVGLQTDKGVVMYLPRSVEVYSHEETMARWKNSRGPKIEGLNPGDLISFTSRGPTLTFIKIQGAGNLYLQSLVKVDQLGQPIETEDAILSGGKISTALGMKHNDIGSISLESYRNRPVFILHKGEQRLSLQQTRALEADILSGIESIDEI